MNAEKLAHALGGEPTQSGWKAHCPAHHDRRPSLAISDSEEGKVLVHCHAGCDQDAVIDSLRREGLWPEKTEKQGPMTKEYTEYEYTDEDGDLLFQVVRVAKADGKKSFFQRQPDRAGDWKRNSKGRLTMEGARLVPYRLHRILKYKEKCDVTIAEGEKDVDNLEKMRFLATCNPMGAGKWKEEFNEFFRDASVAVFQDNDGPGRKHAHEVARNLNGIATFVRVVSPPNPHKDISEWIDAGATENEILGLIDKTLDWEPSDEISDPAPEDELVPGSVQAPQPLRRKVPPPVPYPMDALGDLLGDVACELMHSIQAPDALCGQSVLAAAALAVQPHADISIDGRIGPTSEFFVTVGKSGERKSSVDGEVLRPHNYHQKMLIEERDQELEEYNRIMEDSVDETEEEKEVEKPVKPINPIFLVQEPTYEGLVKLTEFGQPSIGLFAHEGGGLIGGHAMRSENQLRLVTGLSEFWDGRPVSRVRAKDGASILYGRRLSLHLMVQPIVAQMLFGNELIYGQGLLSRCLTVWPESTMGTRFYRPKDLSGSPAMKQYFARMMEILQTPFPLADGKTNELKPLELTLSEKAKVLWVDFHDEVEEQLAPGQRLSQLSGFANKAAEHATRLAGILSIVNDIHTQEINPRHMSAGIELMRFYLSETHRLFGLANSDPDLELAEILLEWVHGHEFIYPQLVYQLGPNSIREKKTAKRILAILEDHGWLVKIEGGLEIEGVHRKEVWQVAQPPPEIEEKN